MGLNADGWSKMPNFALRDGGADGGDEPAPPSEGIIEALAEETDTDPLALPPLYETIDPEALDRLFADRDDGTVTFSYCGYAVTVQHNGEVIVHTG